jgi:hypothetical protein
MIKENNPIQLNPISQRYFLGKSIALQMPIFQIKNNKQVRPTKASRIFNELPIFPNGNLPNSPAKETMITPIVKKNTKFI